MVGFNDLKDLFQTKLFCGSISVSSLQGLFPPLRKEGRVGPVHRDATKRGNE